jgi:syntaxin 5
MPLQDRTNEFHACVESIRNRTTSRYEPKQKLLPNGSASKEKGEFTRMASGIGKDLVETTRKLSKLAQCEFDDYEKCWLLLIIP